jgi:hypothetical protein
MPCIVLAACGDPNQRLDEALFYDGPQFKLKVVRFYRNIPFNYLGEHAVVMCRSESTGDYEGQGGQDVGWRVLGEADARGSKDAGEVARSLQDDYLVFDEQTLIAGINAFNISFDACGHFIGWDPARLPPAAIAAVQKPDGCAPEGPLDCRYVDFEGDRKPRYDRLSVAGTGQVAFRVRSAAFRGVQSLHVHTRNNGAVWHVETTGLETGGPGLQPEKLRSLSLSMLEADAGDISLSDWFESVLPPGSMVIWPDAAAACGEPGAAGLQDRIPQCAEIRFNDSEGNSGAVYLALDTITENRPFAASLHSVVYMPGDQAMAVRSLGGLQEALAGDAK